MFTIQARYVFPVEGEPIENGCVTIEGPRIGWVGSANQRPGDLDLGNVAITPGFVNAHTHLELAPLPGNARSHEVVDELTWLRRVIAYRHGVNEASLTSNATENVRASIAAGTTFLADTTTAGLSWGPVAAASLRAVVFAEVIGLHRDRGLMTDAAAWKWLGSIGPESQIAACAGRTESSCAL